MNRFRAKSEFTDKMLHYRAHMQVVLQGAPLLKGLYCLLEIIAYFGSYPSWLVRVTFSFIGQLLRMFTRIFSVRKGISV